MDERPKLASVEIEEIAQRVVALLDEAGLLAVPPRYVDAATLAAELGVERDWVYTHAEELGALRLGGPRGRLRFDRSWVRQNLKWSKDSDGPAVGRRPGRLSNTTREVAPMMKPERHHSPSSKGRA
jgi:hypothetical protein